eukprot:scaffold11386_cov28-Tisochrysis_lutea.AAC.2
MSQCKARCRRPTYMSFESMNWARRASSASSRVPSNVPTAPCPPMPRPPAGGRGDETPEHIDELLVLCSRKDAAQHWQHITRAYSPCDQSDQDWQALLKAKTGDKTDDGIRSTRLLKRAKQTCAMRLDHREQGCTSLIRRHWRQCRLERRHRIIWRVPKHSL